MYTMVVTLTANNIAKPTITIGFNGPCVSRHYIWPSAKTLLYGSVVLVEESGAPQ